MSSNSDQVTIDSGNFDRNAAGDYTITCTVLGPMGLPVTATREVRIVDPNDETTFVPDEAPLAELPATPAPDAVMPETTIYIVVSGGSLWKISQKLYGTGQRWYSIYDMNIDLIGKTPGNIYAGMALTVPAE